MKGVSGIMRVKNDADFIDKDLLHTFVPKEQFEEFKKNYNMSIPR